MKKIKKYQIEFNPENEELGIQLISFVDKPAIKIKGIKLNSHIEQVEMQFKTQDEKRIVVAPALIPDFPIYRKDNEEGEYYVEFSKETIFKLMSEFNKKNKDYKFNYDHKDNEAPAYVLESWIIENETFDKSRFYGFEGLPIGTWMISAQVTDDNFWENEIKKNGKFGFSVEGFFDLKKMDEFNEMEFEESYTDYPQSVSDNAKKALDWVEQNGWGDCGTPVGKIRANQLANREPISRETIARMASFARHLQYADKELGDGCGSLMVYAWGGKEGIEWAQSKLDEIDAEVFKQEPKKEELTVLQKYFINQRNKFVIEPEAGESESEFVSRCVKKEMYNGYSQDVSLAICLNKYRNKK